MHDGAAAAYLLVHRIASASSSMPACEKDLAISSFMHSGASHLDPVLNRKSTPFAPSELLPMQGAVG